MIEKKIEMGFLGIRVPKDVHLEAKAQAAYRNQSLQEYVMEAILIQIESDKKFRKTIIK